METRRTLFGKFLRELLINEKMSLRELARRTNIDASNLSKMERGVIYPPKKKKTLSKLANALNLNEENKRKLFDYAEQVNGLLPDDLQSIRQNEAIPLLLRAIDNRKLDYETTKKLVKIVEKENEWQGRLVD